MKSLLTELGEILKNRGYKRAALKNSNWLEIITPKKKIHTYLPPG